MWHRAQAGPQVVFKKCEQGLEGQLLRGGSLSHSPAPWDNGLSLPDSNTGCSAPATPLPAHRAIPPAEPWRPHGPTGDTSRDEVQKRSLRWPWGSPESQNPEKRDGRGLGAAQATRQECGRQPTAVLAVLSQCIPSPPTPQLISGSLLFAKLPETGALAPPNTHRGTEGLDFYTALCKRGS